MLSNNNVVTQLAIVQSCTYNCKSFKNAWTPKSLSSHFLTRLIIVSLMTMSEGVGKRRRSGKQNFYRRRVIGKVFAKTRRLSGKQVTMRTRGTSK